MRETRKSLQQPFQFFPKPPEYSAFRHVDGAFRNSQLCANIQRRSAGDDMFPARFPGRGGEVSLHDFERPRYDVAAILGLLNRFGCRRILQVEFACRERFRARSPPPIFVQSIPDHCSEPGAKTQLCIVFEVGHLFCEQQKYVLYNVGRFLAAHTRSTHQTEYVGRIERYESLPGLALTRISDPLKQARRCGVHQEIVARNAGPFKRF